MNHSLIISAPAIFDGETLYQDCGLLIEAGKISKLAKLSALPSDLPHKKFTSGLLAPGFIDLQVNGGGDLLFNHAPSLYGLKTILNAHYNKGTHGLLPTIITSNDETILNALDAVEQGFKENLRGLMGIHLEGPMLNPLRKGIHSEKHIRILSDEVLQRICSINAGTVLVTLAPECVPDRIIHQLIEAGVIVFAGHTMATPTELNRAKSLGIRGFTHLYNAMPQMSSREPNTTGFALNDDEMWCSLIHDGLHINPIMVSLAIKAKKQGKLFLVSDAMSTLGGKEDSFIFDGQTIYKDGERLINKDGTLAGAHLDLATAVNNTHDLGFSLEESIKMASRYPAECIDNKQYGLFKSGYNAAINHYNKGVFTPVSLK